MPDFVLNHVEVFGPAAVVAEFRELMFGVDALGEAVFDFDAIVPMPPELDIVDGSGGSVPYAVFYDPASVEYLFSWEAIRQRKIRTILELQEFFLRERQDGVALAGHYHVNKREHGHPTWYGWRNEHWGSKWNASGLEIFTDRPETCRFCFDTPWSAPEPIFDALAERFPRLSLHVTSEYPDGPHVSNQYGVALQDACHPAQ